MKALYKDLQVRVNAAIAPAGGVHWGVAPSNTVSSGKDFIVLRSAGSSNVSMNTGTVVLETITIHFLAWSRSLATVISTLNKLDKLFFKFGSIISDAVRVINGVKSAEDVFLDPDRTEQGEEIWQGILGYNFTVSRDFSLAV